MNKTNIIALFGLPTHEQHELVSAELAKCIDGDGLDGVALDIISYVLEIGDESMSDADTLELIGIIVNQWQQLV